MNEKNRGITNLKYKDYTYFIRFITVGVINTCIDFSVFTILKSFFGMHYSISQLLGYSSGVINSFILNKIWTFNNKEANRKAALQFSQFVFINLLSLGVSLIGLKLFVNIFEINVYIAKVIVTLFAQVLNFTGYKFWVFVKKEQNY